MNWVARFVGFVTLLFTLGAGARGAFAAPAQPTAARSVAIAASADEAPSDMPRISGVEIPAVPAAMNHIDRGWLQFYYPPAYETEVSELARISESFKTLLAEHFGQEVLAHVEVRLGKDPIEMARLAPREAPPPAYGVGVAYPRLKLIVLSVQDPRTFQAANLPEVYRHELAHVALDDATDGHMMPRWFAEGLAIYQAGEHGFDRQTLLYSAASTHALIPFDGLESSFGETSPNVSLAYAQSADLVRFMFKGTDRARFASMITRVRSGARFDNAVEDAYSTDIRKLDYQWRRDVSARFDWGSWITVALGVAFVGLLALAYFKRRKEARAKLAQWAVEEEMSDRMVQSALARLQTSYEARESTVTPSMAPLEAPRAIVEHEGQVHTLH